MARAALGLLLAAALLQVARAAVHPYSGEYFYSVGDAFIFRGGREGMFESKSEVGLAALTLTKPPLEATPRSEAAVLHFGGGFRVWRWRQGRAPIPSQRASP